MASTSIDAIVVLYHPDEAVLANIRSYADGVDHLFIVDNTETPHRFFDHFPFTHTLLHSGSNIGIAKAYNLALEEAALRGSSWLLTMDQDTAFPDQKAMAILQKSLAGADETAGVVAPLHNEHFRELQGKLEEEDIVMSSASFVNVRAVNAIGGFDERLFIDEIDHACCLRLRMCGYRVLRHKGVAVSHRLGIKKTSGFFNQKAYPALRLYYMLRNYLLVRESYQKTFPAFFRQRDRYLLGFFSTQLLTPKLFSNGAMLLRGWRDYRKRRFGKIEG